MATQKVSFNPQRINLANEDKLSLLSNIVTMLKAGIPITEAVESLQEDATGNLLLILTQLKTDLEQGKQINESFAQLTRVFDKVSINIVKAAEESGTLEKVLEDMKTTMIKDSEFKDKIKGALIYPFFVFIVFSFVLIGMLFFIVPKIGTVFKSLTIPLPLPTKLLIAASDLLVNHTTLIVICFFILVTILTWLARTQKSLLLNAFFNIPGISPIVRDIDLTRFTRTMALLMSSGIPITLALELTMDVVVKSQIKESISDAYQSVMQGGRLSQGLNMRGKFFPGILKKMIEVGEKSGTLDKSLQEASEFLDYQTSKKIKTVTTLLEPIMLVGVAGLVGGMMMAIVAPIYGLIGSIGTK